MSRSDSNIWWTRLHRVIGLWCTANLITNLKNLFLEQISWLIFSKVTLLWIGQSSVRPLFVSECCKKRKRQIKTKVLCQAEESIQRTNFWQKNKDKKLTFSFWNSRLLVRLKPDDLKNSFCTPFDTRKNSTAVTYLSPGTIGKFRINDSGLGGGGVLVLFQIL